MNTPDLIFIRHGKVDLPYPSYADMPFADLCSLANGKSDPPANREFTRDALKETFGSIVFDAPPKIWSGPARRCRDTAEVLKGLLQTSIGDNLPPIEVKASLGEAHFDLAKLYTPPPSGTDMSAVNSAVLKAMAEGVDAESYKSLRQRTVELFQQLAKEGSSVICVIHDYYMRVVELCIRSNGELPDTVSCDDLQKTWRNENCAGFGCGRDFEGLLRLGTRPGFNESDHKK